MPRRRRPTATERSLRARVAINERWARLGPEARSQATSAARAGLEERFRREVDPEGILPADELEERLKNVRSAYYSRLALRSVARQARRRATLG